MDFSEFRPSFAHHPHRIFNINSFLNRLFLYHIIIIDFSDFQPAFAHHPPFARRRAVYFFSFNFLFYFQNLDHPSHFIPHLPRLAVYDFFFIFHFLFVFFCPTRLSVFSSRGAGVRSGVLVDTVRVVFFLCFEVYLVSEKFERERVREKFCVDCCGMSERDWYQKVDECVRVGIIKFNIIAKV